MENLAEEPKITQKINPKTNKAKLNLKKSKEPELTKIDEFLEYGKFKNIFIDTCVLKDLNALFLNKADPDKNNDNENNVIGFSIDTNNHTIFKFNKTPHKFEIERFVLPEKNKKAINKYNDYINDSVGKINLNNISENRGHVNFLKNNYPSESEESTQRKKKQINSNIIANSSKIKKKLKEKNAATIFGKVNINEILNESKSRKKKKKKSVKEKENKNKIYDKDADKEEKKKSKIKEKDNCKEDIYNINTMIVRKNKKSKTKKNNENLQFPKTRIKKRSTSNLHFTNIKKMSIDKNNGDKEDVSVMLDNFKKMNKKYNTKNNNRLRTSTKSCFFNCDDDSKSKKNRKQKYIKFRSEIYSKKNQNAMYYKNKLVQRKQSENIFNKKKNLDENNIFKNDDNDNENGNDNLYSDKSKSKSSKDSDDSSLKSKNKEKKPAKKNSDDLKIFKFESEKIPYNNNKRSENSSEIDSKDSEKNKLKKSSTKKSCHYQIKKVNDICLGDKINGNNNYNNNVIKISEFSVAKPDTLISIEYKKKQEDINIINNSNKNQEVNKETNIDNNIKNNDNDNNNDNNDDKVIFIDNNDNNDNKVIYVDNNNLNGKKNNSKSVKKPCKFLCCL